ncbi:MAG: glycoside hydrolase family 3 N-terminal domain-containing protein [Anaerolineae bacterium]
MLSTLLPGFGPAAVHARTEMQAQTLLDSMSVAERVGQLFLVTFEGDTANEESDIADLILNYHVGGVVLLADNDNITGYGEPANAPFQVAALTNQLQRLALSGLPPEPSELESADAAAGTSNLIEAAVAGDIVLVPLLVAINHEGDGYPHTAIINGLTEIPSSMAIGATWQPQYAEIVGEIVGRELSALGVNMLLGPSLDVLENPAPFSPGDQGTRTFGGDPYWVGRMGQAYTTGVHAGSRDRLAVVAKHFPGNGSSDRPIDEEVATVRKSLEQLKQIELAPFFAVTGNAEDHQAVADALLATHIRYQGFQGNIRATTAPVSFDPQALNSLMQLPEFTNWRQKGGVLVSDALGIRAVERFYDDTEQEFPHRRVAKDAFLAGNDLLYLADFALGRASYDQQLANIKDTILWFREKYVSDPSFQQRVDEAVLRILQLKLRLYEGDFSLQNVTVDESKISEEIGQDEAALVDIAQGALTLIAPSQSELIERLASPPGADDRIVIFTDVRQVRQCSTCPSQPLIDRNALADRMLALYGPEASDQVNASQIRSFSFVDLQDFLDAGPGPILLPTVEITSAVPITLGLEGPLLEVEGTPTSTPTPVPTPAPPPGYFVQESLRDATWIIFAMLDVNPDSQALNEFLALRPDIVRNSRVIVFAYNAPYYLDTTEISKLTAYYGVYSKVDTFIDASVRALFQESPLKGASPVDIEGTSYDLFEKTQPDPDQVIELYIASNGETQSPPSEEPLATSIGDTLRLQTGVILDQNGHPVPDGTMVRFIQQDRIQGVVNIILDVPTTDGVAQLDYVLEARTGPGQFRITAQSGDAAISHEVDISIAEEAQVVIINPTPVPSPTPTPTPTVVPSATPTETPSPTPTKTPVPAPLLPEEPAVRIELSEFKMLLAVFTGLAATAVLAVLLNRRLNSSLQHRIGLPLWGIAGGLVVYDYFVLDLPGTVPFHSLGSWAGLVTTIFGGLGGLALYLLRRRLKL